MPVGDVGVGLNVRRLRNQFLAQFITTYSIRCGQMCTRSAFVLQHLAALHGDFLSYTRY